MSKGSSQEVGNDSGSNRENIDVNMDVNIDSRRVSRLRDQPTLETEVLKLLHAHTPEYNYLPPVVNCSISIPIKTLERS